MTTQTPHAMPLQLTGGLVLASDGPALCDLDLAEGRIVDRRRADARKLDLSGLVVLPGIVDSHGDGFERHLAPRRGAVDIASGLDRLAVELLANGITTAILPQYWSWAGGMRGPDFATRLARALAQWQGAPDLRLQLRWEIACLGNTPEVEALIEETRIGYVVFNDSLPHEALSKGRPIPRLTGQALRAGRSPEEHMALLQRLQDGMPTARALLPAVASRLAARGVALGSHDDDSPGQREANRRAGLSIAEFPTTLETALAARDAGDPVVLGAPNVVRGGSHTRGGLAAAAALERGAGTALASDYHYPSCREAAAALLRAGMPLAEAWALVSSGPARVLGLGDRGLIAPGLRADLVIATPDLSRIHGTIAAGSLAFADHVLAERMLR